jgi:hypothetical protein
MRNTIMLITVYSFIGLGCSDSPPPNPQAGEVLVTKYQCTSCHGADLSGSDWPTPGTFAYASNLTPDPDSGLAAWTDDQVAAAITDGVDDTDAPLCTAMPRYALSAAQVGGLVAYLRSVPPVVHAVPSSDCTTTPSSDIDDAGVDDAGVIIIMN